MVVGVSRTTFRYKRLRFHELFKENTLKARHLFVGIGLSVKACVKQRTRLFTVDEVRLSCVLHELGSSCDMNCFSLSRYCA